MQDEPVFLQAWNTIQAEQAEGKSNFRCWILRMLQTIHTLKEHLKEQPLMNRIMLYGLCITLQSIDD